MIRQKILMIRFNNGDSTALCDMYALYKDDLVGLACALLNDKSSAEDLVHDIFSKLIDKQGDLKIKTNLKQYLLTAVANAVRQKYRSNKNVTLSLDEGNLPIPETNNLPEANIVSDEQNAKIRQALLSLPYDQREVILLKHFSDMKLKDIAAIQDVSINTVNGRYRYGIDKLRSSLNGELS